MKKIEIIIAVFAVLFSSTFISCDKEETPAALEEIVVEDAEAIAQEDAEMESMMDVISGQIENYTAADIEATFPLTSSLKSSTKEVTYPQKSVEYPNSPAKWPRIITVDYGPEDIIISIKRFEEVAVRGKITINKTAAYLTIGSLRTVSFDEFYFNDNHIGGEKLYTNKGLNENGNLVFEWVIDIKATTPDHFWRKRKVRKERELIAGADTKVWSDNEFHITGLVTGSNSNKWKYTRTIIEPLHRLNWHKYPVSGTIEVVNSNRTFSIDYGNGEEDDLATITKSDGEVKEITLGNNK
ncbi:hypothetical protein OAA06_00690 [bacterium]|nr:hypothetical protein [bacterium]